jgi:DNA-directed RNA polymerase subunit L
MEKTENLKNNPPFACPMELTVIEESQKKFVFQLKGAGHTLCNALKHELWNNAHIKVATYVIKHPLIGIPELTIETDGTIKPRKAVSEALEKLIAKADKFSAAFKKVKV